LKELLGYWRRLRLLDMNSIDDMVDVVVATCTLHNICPSKQDELLSILRELRGQKKG
jgi:hypothetical protein